jgi:single-strand DNA-binding protein
MSRSLNEVKLIGNVGQDPEVRSTTGGSRVATLSLATTRTWTDRNDGKQEKTEWHRLVVWGKLADVVEEYVKKGDRLYVSGRIEYRKWQDKDDNTRYSTEINVQELIMLGAPSGQRPTAGGDEVPEGTRRVRERAARQQPAKAKPEEDFEDFPGALADEDDDLPF